MVGLTQRPKISQKTYLSSSMMLYLVVLMLTFWWVLNLHSGKLCSAMLSLTLALDLTLELANLIERVFNHDQDREKFLTIHAYFIFIHALNPFSLLVVEA
jgi:hypothetical protein